MESVVVMLYILAIKRFSLSISKRLFACNTLLLCQFRSQTFTARHNFSSCVALSKNCLFTINLAPRSATHSYMVVMLPAVSLCPFSVRYPLWVSYFPNIPSSLLPLEISSLSDSKNTRYSFWDDSLTFNELHIFSFPLFPSLSPSCSYMIKEIMSLYSFLYLGTFILNEHVFFLFIKSLCFIGPYSRSGMDLQIFQIRQQFFSLQFGY